MRITISNAQAGAMINSMRSLLDRRDLIGYAAAYNTRVLTQVAQEYIDLHETLLAKYGKEVLGHNGEHTMKYVLEADNPNYQRFIDETSEWASATHDVDVFTVPAEKAIGELSGNEILSVQWMFDWNTKE